jgi:predicted nucleotidyltransferase component of viral defense system
MIEFLQQQIAPLASVESKINRLREILQLVCLKIMQDKGCFANLAFVGGTALRILFDLRRFSEDLDFSVIDKKGYDFGNIAALLKHEFNLRGLNLETKTKEAKTVQSSMLKFPRLLKELGISVLESQKLSIKIEADSNPPDGWHIENTVVNKVYLLNLTHFALPSLYATKIHSCVFRKYTKGRDFYDLVWYLGKKVKPNYELLNNAIKQTEGESPGLSDKNIKGFLLDKISRVNFAAVKKDIERFLEDKSELQLLDGKIISKAIEDTF